MGTYGVAALAKAAAVATFVLRQVRAA